MIAVYIDNELTKFDHEIKYSIDFIFKTLGLEFKYIKRIEQVLANDILLFYGTVEPNLKEAYILAMRKILVYIPCDQELLLPGSIKRKDVETWKKEIHLDKSIPVLAFNDFEIPVKYYQDEDLFYASFQFDPIGNIFKKLTDYKKDSDSEEQLIDAPLLESSPLIPSCNYLCWLIEQCLVDAVQKTNGFFLIKKEFWPQGETGAIAISHNVDRLRKWNAGRIMKSAYEDLLLFYKIKYLIENFFSKIRYLTTNIEEYWNFDMIREIEDNFKIKSTYFWGTESETQQDIDYKISSKDVIEEIDLLQEKSHEIALLASVKSYNNDILKRQKQKLSQLILREKIGIRQNGYNYDENATEELLSKHNFAYDSSRISADSPGFVNGIGFPFHTFMNSGKKAENGIYSYKNLEVPITFSDEHLLLSKTRNISEDAALEILFDLLDSIRLTNGLLTFNFSVANFTELDYDAEIFSRLLEHLAKKNFYQATFLEIADWWRRRENLEITEYEDSIDIYFPERIENCCFKIYGNVKVKEILGTEAEIVDNQLKFKQVLADKKIQIKLKTKKE